MTQRTYSFTRSHRISGKVAFAKVFDEGVKDKRGPLVVFARANTLPQPRLGLNVSRHVGTAPQRNRIKRLLRESFRLLQHDFPRGYDWVIVVRPHEPLLLADYQKILSGFLVRTHAAATKLQERK